jgi:ADP-ribosylglycohydrolase
LDPYLFALEFSKSSKNAGINSAHRNCIFSMFPKLFPQERLFELAKEESCITHTKDQSIECAYASNMICSLLIEGKTIEETLEILSKDEKIETNDVKDAIKMKFKFDKGGYAVNQHKNFLLLFLSFLSFLFFIFKA